MARGRPDRGHCGKTLRRRVAVFICRLRKLWQLAPSRCRIRRGTGDQVMASLRNLARLSEPAVTGLSCGDVSDSLTRARDEFVCFDKNACFGLNSLVFLN